MNTSSSLLIGGLVALSFSAQAEVKSLSSSELTDTYIKDSTIIVTPKKQEIETQKKTYSSLTIAPVQNSDQDFDKLNHLQNHVDSSTSSFLLNEDRLREYSIATATTIPQDVEILNYYEANTLPMEEIMNDSRFAVPEGNFDFVYVGGDGAKDLGLSRTDNQLTFSIGNLPQIDKIEIPHAVNEGPLQITPRVGGGFDLTINIPQDN